MKVKKCDRCGAIFGDNSDFSSDGLVGWLREKGKVDFCDNCVESFLQWFRDGKQNQTNRNEEKQICRNCGNYNQLYSICGDCKYFDNKHCEKCIITDPNGIACFTHFEHKKEGWI